MAGQTTPTGDIVREYLKRYKTESTRAIALFLQRDCPDVFISYEQTRSLVRYHRGIKSTGKMFNPDPIAQVDYGIPEPDLEEYKPYIIDIEAAPMVISSDWHVPYHDKDALEIMLDHATDIGAKCFLLNGDIMDFYGLSRFQKDPRRRSSPEEIEMLKLTLAGIRAAFPEAKILFKEGNHEERYTAYIQGQAPELWGLDDIRLENVLHLKEYGVEFINKRRVMTFDKLHIIHGHEYIGGITAPVNPARGLYLRAKKSTICGHHHQSSEHTEPSIDGAVVTCWTIGCLCQPHPQYMPLNKWNHGFAVASWDDGFMVENKRIINYRLM